MHVARCNLLLFESKVLPKQSQTGLSGRLQKRECVTPSQCHFFIYWNPDIAAFVTPFCLDASSGDLVTILCPAHVQREVTLRDLNVVYPVGQECYVKKFDHASLGTPISRLYSSTSVIKGRAAPMGSCRNMIRGLSEFQRRVSGLKIKKLLQVG